MNGTRGQMPHAPTERGFPYACGESFACYSNSDVKKYQPGSGRTMVLDRPRHRESSHGMLRRPIQPGSKIGLEIGRILQTHCNADQPFP